MQLSTVAPRLSQRRSGSISNGPQWSVFFLSASSTRTLAHHTKIMASRVPLVTALAALGAQAFAPQCHRLVALPHPSKRSMAAPLPRVQSTKLARSKRALAAPSPPRVESTTRALAPTDLVSASRALATLPTLYALMSINEYITHRYYQHAEFNKSPWLQRLARAVLAPFGMSVPTVKGGGHVEHHAETLDDMTLKTDTKWRSTAAAKRLDADPYRGTAFSWHVSGMMTLQMLPTTLPIFTLLLGFSLPTTFAFLLPAMLLHALVWNSLHPAMHALPDVPMGEGAPSRILAGFRDSAYFRFLYKNHQGTLACRTTNRVTCDSPAVVLYAGHHIVGGRGNYNVCLPGADHLFGTYIPESEWRPKATTTYASHHGVDLPIDLQIQNHVERELTKN